MILTDKERNDLAEAIVGQFRKVPAALQSHLKNELNYDLPPVCTEIHYFGGAVHDLVAWFDQPEFIVGFLKMAEKFCPNYRVKTTLDRVSKIQGVHLGNGKLIRPEIAMDNPDDPFESTLLWEDRLPFVRRQVCRITFGEQSQGTGTGFLIGPDLVMTNYHVIFHGTRDDPEERYCDPAQVICEFDFNKVNEPARKVGLHEDWLPFWGSRTSKTADAGLEASGPDPDELDYAVIRLAAPVGRDRGWVEFPSNKRKGLFGESMGLIIVQHPKDSPNSWAYQPNSIERRAGFWTIWNGLRVRHRTNTRGGSSGSPCFDQHWRLVALHHSGYDGLGLDPYFSRTNNAHRGLIRYNQAIPMDKIRDHLESKWHWSQPQPGGHVLEIASSSPDFSPALQPPPAMTDNLRSDLIVKLKGLTESDLRDFVSSNYGPKYRPALNHGTTDIVTNLMDWIESTNGPGLTKLTRDFYSFLSQDEPNQDQRAANSGTSGTVSTSVTPSTSVTSTGNMPAMSQSERLNLIDDLERMPAHYLKAFIRRYYDYEPVDGEKHEIVVKFLDWAAMANVSLHDIREKLEAYKSRFGGGGGGGSVPEPPTQGDTGTTTGKKPAAPPENLREKVESLIAKRRFDDAVKAMREICKGLDDRHLATTTNTTLTTISGQIHQLEEDENGAAGTTDQREARKIQISKQLLGLLNKLAPH